MPSLPLTPLFPLTLSCSPSPLTPLTPVFLPLTSCSPLPLSCSPCPCSPHLCLAPLPPCPHSPCLIPHASSLPLPPVPEVVGTLNLVWHTIVSLTIYPPGASVRLWALFPSPLLPSPLSLPGPWASLRPQESLGAIISIQQPWGFSQSSLCFSHSLHPLHWEHLEAFGSLWQSWGLSLSQGRCFLAPQILSGPLKPTWGLKKPWNPLVALGTSLRHRTCSPCSPRFLTPIAPWASLGPWGLRKPWELLKPSTLWGLSQIQGLCSPCPLAPPCHPHSLSLCSALGPAWASESLGNLWKSLTTLWSQSVSGALFLVPYHPLTSLDHWSPRKPWELLETFGSFCASVSLRGTSSISREWGGEGERRGEQGVRPHSEK